MKKGEVQRTDNDNDNEARGRMIILKFQCPNFLKTIQNQILLDKTELKNVLEIKEFRDLQSNPNSLSLKDKETDSQRLYKVTKLTSTVCTIPSSCLFLA